MTREYHIAYGNSRMAKTWSNKVTTFDGLCERLAQTVRTTETAEEYPKLPKGRRDEIKDKGGFVAGVLKGGRRKKETVASRSMLTHDADHPDVDFIKKYEQEYPYQSCLYTTHGHTPESPRVRIITPLSRDVTPDEYAALSRFIAADLGIDYFDPCSYAPHQLMYWPTTPANGEYVFKRKDGDVLDPDEYLSHHPDWRDCSTLPTSSKESAVKPTAAKKLKDPLTKDGVVGAFCNAFTVEDAIHRFLPDVYRPSAVAGRYDYVPADSTAGVVIYDDGRFAYSNHASDPAYQMELNAFDLVRIHKFPADDERQSYREMADFAVSLDEVKMKLAQKKIEDAQEDFDEDAWTTKLTYDKKGNIEDTLDNLALILRYDDGLQHIAFNCHRDGIDAKGGLPWEQIKPGWNDSDFASLKLYLSGKYGIYSPTKTKDAVLAVAAERAYHPIKNYLDGLPEWDQVPRVETLLIDYFGAEDTAYTRAVSRKFLAAAVARIYRPGTKFDSVLILNGPQGIGKSTFFAKLAGDWFSDSLTLTDMKDKSGPEKLQGYWILELGELAGMRKADVETVKSFLSRVDDKYRASYGISVESHPRQCIVVGSTNAESGFLRDITGNRRFWPVRVHSYSKKKAWQLSKEDVEQIWAETIVIYRNSEKLYLEGDDLNTEAGIAQDLALEADEREGLVRRYLDTLLPEDWKNKSLYERREFLSGGDFGQKNEGKFLRDKVCNMEIWSECFGKDSASMRPADSYAIAAIMKKISGWEKIEKANFGIYGRQRGYQRLGQ